MKRIKLLALVFSALLTLTLLISCSGKKTKVPDQTDTFYVYDEANVLDSETERYIIGKNVDLFDKCGGQIVVACVNTTGNYDIKDFAYAVFNKWKIGSADKNNGVLLLLSIDEDDYWVLQGNGLETLLQSGTLKLMLNDCLEPYFAKKQYAEGVVALFDALIEKYEQIYSVSITQIDVSLAPEVHNIPDPNTAQSGSTGATFWSVITAIATVIVMFTVIIIILVIIVSVVVTIFIIFATALGSGSGNSAPRTFRSSGGININPHSFRSSGSYRGSSHSTGGFTFGGFSSGRSGGGFSSGRTGGGFSSGRSGGGFSSGRSGGGFSGGHHSGGGGFSRGGGAGRR